MALGIMSSDDGEGKAREAVHARTHHWGANPVAALTESLRAIPRAENTDVSRSSCLSLQTIACI